MEESAKLHCAVTTKMTYMYMYTLKTMNRLNFYIVTNTDLILIQGGSTASFSKNLHTTMDFTSLLVYL